MVRTSDGSSAIIRSITFSSSRTLPGQWYFSIERMASDEIRFCGTPIDFEYLVMKCSTSSAMSSRRCRSGGSAIGMTLMR